ncbi:D-glycero-beta-D-manno-heptose 1,7-bisphosphate 7-phosphatase [Leeia sp. TBRC 13508]|uniref:D,D-heptose 1,7-bisphosphate phosphatase n=1 Tax=Leeia speluncae TaxID=2884804 RepID=A0ABS8D5G8_9NEIS|nr:D-glycero-beta-D-manno-heptose 1,7-bisphosphate 7-phosphatase [Leeia speluncae]MCB6183372.1 D-glycero-beta-D-manno-heptose 1,7-bisphosphate 7-phosphatase [Leeia speluncae]
MKLIILDRDGVINFDSDEYVKSVDEWIPLPGSIEAIARLTKAGWQVAIATNQSGIARGYFDLSTLDAMHDKLATLLTPLGGKIDKIEFCPHGPDVSCDCRKPLPGMFRTIADHYGLADLSGIPVVGDSLRDLEAGMQLGATPYLVKTGKGERTIAKGSLPQGTIVCDDLAAVVDALLTE